MLSPEALPDRILASLSGLGLSPRLSDHGDHVCIETEVSDSASVESWGALVALLETADNYGLITSAEFGQIVWATVSKDAPAASDASAAGGHCHQLYRS